MFPPSPQCSVPARYARLHYALGGGGEETKTTTNILLKVPNLFQDLTASDTNSTPSMKSPTPGWRNCAASSPSSASTRSRMTVRRETASSRMDPKTAVEMAAKE